MAPARQLPRGCYVLSARASLLAAGNICRLQRRRRQQPSRTLADRIERTELCELGFGAGSESRAAIRFAQKEERRRAERCARGAQPRRCNRRQSMCVCGHFGLIAIAIAIARTQASKWENALSALSALNAPNAPNARNALLGLCAIAAALARSTRSSGR